MNIGDETKGRSGTTVWKGDKGFPHDKVDFTDNLSPKTPYFLVPYFPLISYVVLVALKVIEGNRQDRRKVPTWIKNHQGTTKFNRKRVKKWSEHILKWLSIAEKVSDDDDIAWQYKMEVVSCLSSKV